MPRASQSAARRPSARRRSAKPAFIAPLRGDRRRCRQPRIDPVRDAVQVVRRLRIRRVVEDPAAARERRARPHRRGCAARSTPARDRAQHAERVALHVARRIQPVHDDLQFAAAGPQRTEPRGRRRRGRLRRHDDEREVRAANRLFGLRRRIARGVDQHDAVGRSAISSSARARARGIGREPRIARGGAGRVDLPVRDEQHAVGVAPRHMGMPRLAAAEQALREAMLGQRVEAERRAHQVLCIEFDRDDRPAATREQHRERGRKVVRPAPPVVDAMAIVSHRAASPLRSPRAIRAAAARAASTGLARTAPRRAGRCRAAKTAADAEVLCDDPHRHRDHDADDETDDDFGNHATPSLRSGIALRTALRLRAAK